jgi:hypothetical protein
MVMPPTPPPAPDDDARRDAARLRFLESVLAAVAAGRPAAAEIIRETPAHVDAILDHPAAFQRLLLAEPASLAYDDAAKLHTQMVVLWLGITTGYLARPQDR